MICVLLAAGYATRMYPLTLNFPKPLLESKGKTILDWMVDDFSLGGKISRYVVISNHKYLPHFEKWVELKREQGFVMDLLDDRSTDNDNRLGAVKDIEFAIDELSLSDDLLVLAGNTFAKTSADTLVVTTQPQMHCQNCEKKIKSNIRFVNGTKKIDTSVEDQKVTIVYDCKKAKYNDYVEAFKKIGYDIKKK